MSMSMAEVKKKSGDILMTAKAYNGRCILEFLAFELENCHCQWYLSQQSTACLSGSLHVPSLTCIVFKIS